MQRPLRPTNSANGRASALLLILLTLAAAIGWWYLAPRSMPAWLSHALPASPSLGPPLYKWHDAKGRLHVTDQPPTDRPYETVHYDPKANVVPSGPSP